MAYFNDSSPADTEAVKKGASVIRAMKTALNTVVGKIFDDAGNFLDKWITTSQIGDAQVTAQQIADGAIGTSELASAAVTNPKIAAGAVGSGQLADGAVTSGKIGAAAVGPSAIAAAAITSPAIATGAVLAAAIAAGVIDRSKFSTGAVAQSFTGSATASGTGVVCTTGFQPDFVLVSGMFGNFSGFAVGVAFRGEGSTVHIISGTSNFATMTYSGTGFTFSSSGGGVFYFLAIKTQS